MLGQKPDTYLAAAFQHKGISVQELTSLSAPNLFPVFRTQSCD